MSDRIDSRDLIQEADELRARLDDPEAEPLDDEERATLTAIDELADAGIEDWQYGAQLIPEDDFEDFARELAEETGLIDESATWPHTCIDWERAATELSTDYTTVEYLGTTYYVR
jgi:hypothetical protein